MNIAIIGAGNGGHAAAGALGLAGHTVRLYDIRDEVLAPVRRQGGIRVSGVHNGLAPVAYAGTDPAEAVRDAALVMVIVPGMAHTEVAATLSHFLEPEQVVLLHPGCTGGALEFRHVLEQQGLDLPVAETDNFLYACRWPEPGHSIIAAVKARLRIGILPPERATGILARLQSVFPGAEGASSVLETSLANMNAMMHVGPMLANAGRIQFTGGQFDFYGQGISPSVARLVEQVDAERLGVCRTLGVPTLSIQEWIQETYGVGENNLYQTIKVLNREIYKGSAAPRTLDNRYLTEDVPVGMVPIEAIGRLVGLPMTVTGSLVTLASLAMSTDYRREGRTLDRMGLTGLDAGAIRLRSGIGEG